MKIGKYFTLDELTVSETAARRGLSNQPDMDAQSNLRRLVEMVLDPLRASIGTPIVVTSGYRSPQVNKLIGGASSSQHVVGQAADIIVPGMSVAEVCQRIQQLGLPYDQLIDEFGRWTHVSYGPRNRKHFMTARRIDGKTVYQRG